MSQVNWAGKHIVLINNYRIDKSNEYHEVKAVESGRLPPIVVFHNSETIRTEFIHLKTFYALP